MIKITNLEQVKEIKLSENTLFYIYGKTGRGKTHFSKELIKQNKQKGIYTTFEEISQNISNDKYMNNLLEKDFIIIDDEIKQIEQKEMLCISIERKLEEIQNRKIGIIIIGSLPPEELKLRKTSLVEFILSGEQIEICYDIESRIKIAKEYAKQSKIEINENIMKAIVKEENIGKIRGIINRMCII